jgi:hyperosmotically inducible protein
VSQRRKLINLLGRYASVVTTTTLSFATAVIPAAIAAEEATGPAAPSTIRDSTGDAIDLAEPRIAERPIAERLMSERPMAELEPAVADSNINAIGEPLPADAVIDPAVAIQEKPGAAATQVPIKDDEVIAAESAHVRGFNTVVNDAYLTTRVKMSLAVDNRTPAADINVDTENGKVTLFGIVPSEAAKNAAEVDARAIAGVEQVDNTLQVVADDRKPDVQAHDEALWRDLKRNLKSNPSMNGLVIDVKNCVVRLTGTTPAGKAHDEVIRAIRETPGVCKVKDEVRFVAL